MGEKKKVELILGPMLLVICIFILPKGVFETFESRAAIGTVAWMAFWWVAAPVDFAITALLPIVVNALLRITDQSNIISNYASETIILLLGASILTVSWEQTGVDKRIAAKLLSLIGNRMRTQVVFWFLFSAMLSTVLPNAVVCATIIPIAVSMLKYVGEGDIANSSAGSKLLLTVVYGAGVGGLATPLGGAMNLVAVDYIQQLTGNEYMYINWVSKFLPIMLVLIVSNVWYMIRNVSKNEILGGSREYFETEYQKLGPIRYEEVISLLLFVVAGLMSFARQLYENVLPGMKPAYVFLACAIISFMFTRADGSRLMKWKSVQKNIVWDMIFVFAGGLAAGTIINSSNAAQDLGNAVSSMGVEGGFLTVFIILLFTILLSDITSNTATASVAIPIVISMIQGIGMNPIPYIYITIIGTNLSYMLPTSIRAIPVGYGLKPQYMFKEGVKITAIVIALMSILSFVLLKYWPWFSMT